MIDIEMLKNVAFIALAVLIGVIAVYLAMRLASRVVKSVIVILCVIVIVAVVFFVFIKSAAPVPPSLYLLLLR